MKLYSLLITCFTFLFFAAPAYAGKLMFWRFETAQNRLIFSTDQGVQPTAQLISNPTRLVIDLPGTILGRPTVNENFNGLITSLRIGQFDSRTTRLVVELAPGYTLDPQEIKIRGISPTQWTVDLPNPERGTLSSPESSSGSSYNQSVGKSTPISVVPYKSSAIANNRTYRQENQRQIRNVSNTVSNNSSSRSVVSTRNRNMGNSGLTLTSNGLLIGLDGENINNDDIEIRRSRNKKQVEIELEGVTIPADLEKLWSVNQYGVGDVEIKESESNPNKTIVVLNVEKDSPDWQASFSRSVGLVLWPQGGVTQTAKETVDLALQPQPKPQTTSNAVIANKGNYYNTRPINRGIRNDVQGKTNIELIQFAQNQLIIQGNKKIDAQGSWNPRSGIYQIRLNNTDLAPNFKPPQLPVGSPISRMRIWQPDGDTVILLLQPAAGAKFNKLNQPSEKILSLSVTQYHSGQMNPTKVPVASPTKPWQPNSSPSPDYWERNPPIRQTNPQPSKSKTLVVIDPGHGGKDPGAVGIGGVQEKHIVMAISQEVTRILELNGIQVKMSRSDDYFVSLQGRTDMANRMDADLFVSIHANSAGMNKPHVSGFEVYYFQAGKNLASTIHRNVLRQVNVRDRKVRKARFYVLRKSAMPAVLVEAGFLTGTEDAAKLRNPRYQKQMAQAIASGIIEYVKANGM